MPEYMLDKVIIEAGEYAGLQRESNELEVLVDLLLDSADLNYREDGLTYNSETISAFLRTRYRRSYNEKLEKLKKEKEVANNE